MLKTSEKGDIAVTKVIADLTEKGYGIFLPISQHLKFDLIAVKDDILLKIQVKYCGETTSKNGSHLVRNRQIFCNTKETRVTKYKDSDFDYYAMYLDDIKKTIYVPFSFGGASIRSIISKTTTLEFYWYEDFLEINNNQAKRSLEYFGFTREKTDRKKKEKISWPSKEELEKLILDKNTIAMIGRIYGVSGNAVRKRCIKYNIPYK